MEVEHNDAYIGIGIPLVFACNYMYYIAQSKQNSYLLTQRSIQCKHFERLLPKHTSDFTRPTQTRL